MKHRARLVCLLLIVLVGALVATPASAAPRGGPEEARENVKAALREGKYAFCTSPKKPMMPREGALCPLADEIEGCEGFARACDVKPPAEDLGWLAKLAQLLAPVARVLVWVLVAIIVLAIAVPVVLALLRLRRDRKLRDEKVAERNVAEPLAPPVSDSTTITDAEAALREAEEHARRGELDRALGLYLAASLAALDRRGAIRVARHRTNGEYVRACAEEPSRQPLREIVREVDRVEYGKLPATAEAVSRVAARASTLVRVTTLTIALFLLAGCNALKHGGPDDPASDELPREVLTRGGYAVARLESSLATLPMPESPVLVIVDASHVALEDDTRAHLMAWVEKGGRLLLLGEPRTWPTELDAKPDHATTRDLVVRDGYVTGARVAVADALTWAHAAPEATLGDSLYAAHVMRGEGRIVGVANADLFTNVGVARPDNAAALVALVEVAAMGAHEIRVARPEDGVPPPSNPFAALVRAGLAKAAWHALAASLLLFLAYGIRQARPRPAPPPTRRAFAEHVEATGAFYRRTRSHALALAAYGRFAELRLRERLPRGADPATFLATRASISREEAARIWTRATQADRDAKPEGDELSTIKELRALLAKALS